MQTIFIDGDPDQPRYRSGAVARMLEMPVATLRIWERRYRVSAPPQTPGGHRLYSAAQVERLLLLKQAVGLGHAIGSVAGLDTAALQRLLETRAALALRAAPALPERPRAALLGVGLGQRLGLRRLQAVGSWLDLAQAEQACEAGPLACDLLVAELATLQPATAERLLALRRQLGQPATVLVYGFGTQAAAQALRAAGCTLRQAPLSDPDLRQLVAEVLAARAGAGAQGPHADPGLGHDRAAVAAPGEGAHWPDAPLPRRAAPPRRLAGPALRALAAQAGQAGGIGCECPRHLADLVALLADFETYSAECATQGPEGQALHAQLARSAGHARALIETALLHLARLEGLVLPDGEPVVAERDGTALAG